MHLEHRLGEGDANNRYFLHRVLLSTQASKTAGRVKRRPRHQLRIFDPNVGISSGKYVEAHAGACLCVLSSVKVRMGFAMRASIMLVGSVIIASAPLRSAAAPLRSGPIITAPPSKAEPCPPGYHLLPNTLYTANDPNATRECVRDDESQTAPGETVEPSSNNNETWISTARAAVAEMQLLARTHEESEFANRDRILVEKAAALVVQRSAALKQGRKVRDAQMSFNLQYLQLQSQMQNENRSYALISNIMKAKHDTVKNSISNIR